MHGMIRSENLNELFVELQHGMNTWSRARNDLLVPCTHSQFGQKSISVMGSLIWNSMSIELNARSVGIFKKLY